MMMTSKPIWSCESTRSEITNGFVVLAWLGWDIVPRCGGAFPIAAISHTAGIYCDCYESNWSKVVRYSWSLGFPYGCPELWPSVVPNGASAGLRAITEISLDTINTMTIQINALPNHEGIPETNANIYICSHDWNALHVWWTKCVIPYGDKYRGADI